MKFVFTGEFDIDTKAERHRINRCFRGKKYVGAKKRQLEILDCLEKEKDFNKVIDLYNDLPYHDDAECPEQEFTGMWFSTIVRECLYPKFKMTSHDLV